MHDVVIVGAGVIGAGVARELARFDLDVVVLEMGPDVASGASRANSGIVHGGYDAVPGSLKAKYNVAGNPLFEALSAELDFPFRRRGSLVVAFSPEEVRGLEALVERGRRNGVAGLSILARDAVLAMEPNLGPDVFAALHVPSGGIVCPYEMTIALAENAAENGVKFLFNHRVERVERAGGAFRLETTGGVFASKVLVNAAGLYADVINNMLSKRDLAIVPRRGEYQVLDRSVGDLVGRTLFQLPGEMGKGVLLTPTVEGNLLVGPTSEDVGDKENRETTRAGLAYVARLAGRDVASFPGGAVISSFAGLRAHETVRGDFCIGPCPDVAGLINVAGIESPGLTSAPAIARDVGLMVGEVLRPVARGGFVPERRGVRRFRDMGLEERREAIAGDGNYGHVVCRCEHVTKAEVLGVMGGVLGVGDIDGIKRRTRVGMGRCQGGFCGMEVVGIVAEGMGVGMEGVRKFGEGSEILLGETKEWL